MNVQEQVQQFLAPILGGALSVELYDVDFSGATLRVVVDGPDGITTDRLAEVSRLISPILDQHDLIPGRYTLEVSSPGLERHLKRAVHLQRAVGEDVLVKMVPSVKPRRYKGRLAAVSGPAAEPTVDAGAPVGPSDHIVLDVTDEQPPEAAIGGTVALDGEITVEAAEIDGVPSEPTPHRLDLAQVASVRTVFSWGPGPKPGSPKPGSPKSGAKAGASKPGSAKIPRRQPDSEQPGSPVGSPTSEVSDE